MPYDNPKIDLPCSNCDVGPTAGDSMRCWTCKCQDTEFMRSENAACDDNWSPFQWTCDMCKTRYIASLRTPAIVTDGLTICDSPACLGAILQGLEAMRRAGLAVYGIGKNKQYTGCVQPAWVFYQFIAQAGMDEL